MKRLPFSMSPAELARILMIGATAAPIIALLSARKAETDEVKLVDPDVIPNRVHIEVVNPARRAK